MHRSLIAPEMLAGEYLFRRYEATVDDYERAADEDARLELLDGVLIMHSPANVRHEEVFWMLGALLRGYAERTLCGRAFGSRTPMILGDKRRFEPDLLFIGQDKLARLGDTALDGPADLVIEILSPATRAYDLGEKRDAYAVGGVGEYWMIDLAESKLLIDRPAGARIAEISSGRCDCPAVPGFWLLAEWLWAAAAAQPTDVAAKLAEIIKSPAA